MATNANAIAPVAPPKISKNEYFTYDDSGHRETKQLWNSENVTICVQGTIDGAPENTYFAKKHLLTFQGGKAASKSAGFGEKGEDIYDKRMVAGKGSKYGKTRIDPNDPKGGKSTYIVCDDLPAEHLWKLFAVAVKAAAAAGKKEALIDLGKPIVWTLSADYTWTQASQFIVQFWNNANKDRFLIKHYKGV